MSSPRLLHGMNCFGRFVLLDVDFTGTDGRGSSIWGCGAAWSEVCVLVILEVELVSDCMTSNPMKVVPVIKPLGIGISAIDRRKNLSDQLSVHYCQCQIMSRHNHSPNANCIETTPSRACSSRVSLTSAEDNESMMMCMNGVPTMDLRAIECSTSATL